MGKVKTEYVCQSCGYSSVKWLGRCPGCENWNTLVEERMYEPATSSPARTFIDVDSSSPSPLTDVDTSIQSRHPTGMEEFDRVLGGGMVRGGVVLVGGDPGIGKSTLLLQAMGKVAKRGNLVLYVSGEESARQIKMRAERLGIDSPNLLVWTEILAERITEKIKELLPSCVVVDSVQTLYSGALSSSPGSVSQVREVTALLISTVKSLEIPLFLVGHVTKDGSIAGPRVLEHMVDTVLYFDGSSGNTYRILRAVKNRYGSVMEIGVFEMADRGLREVKNPSEIFLAERPEGSSGSAVTASLEGTRVVLVEIQALVSPSYLGMPRRTVVGLDPSRVALIGAVLEKKAGIRILNHDIFVKVAGGIRVDEPAVDLAVVAALASNFLDRPVDEDTLLFGEVGLAGEVRGVTRAEQRIKEAEKLGFKRCILAEDSIKALSSPSRCTLEGVKTVKEAIDVLFG